MTGCI